MALTQVVGGLIAPSTTLTTPIVATTMGVGGATAAASGSGITFPATQSASADANTLDDYEEGTWTVTVPSGGSFSSQTARYVKVGKLVFCSFEVTCGTNTSGDWGGLPFAFTSSPSAGCGVVGYHTGTAATWTIALESTTSFSIRGPANTQNQLTAGQRMYAAITYQASA